MEGLRRRRKSADLPTVGNQIKPEVHSDAGPPAAPFGALPAAWPSLSAAHASGGRELVHETSAVFLDSAAGGSCSSTTTAHGISDLKLVEDRSRSSISCATLEKRSRSIIACATITKSMYQVSLNAPRKVKPQKHKPDAVEEEPECEPCDTASSSEVDSMTISFKATTTWFRPPREAGANAGKSALGSKSPSASFSESPADSPQRHFASQDPLFGAKSEVLGDEKTQKMWQRRYLNTLTNGYQAVRSLKVMFLGHARNGKTSTLRALAGLPFNPEVESTQGAKLWSLENKMVSPTERAWEILQDRHTDHLQQELVDECAKKLLHSRSAPQDKETDVCTKMADDLCIPLPVIPASLQEKISSVEKHKPDSDSAKAKNNGLLLSTWDCAGQPDYYAFVHLFLSKLGVYMLCTDFSAWVTDGRIDHSEAFDFWIGSLYTFAPEATVIVIATKLDKLSPEEQTQSKRRLQEHLEDRLAGLGDFARSFETNGDLLFFPTSNRTGEGIDVLRMAVEAAALKTLAKVSRKIPYRWVHLLATLKNRKNDENSDEKEEDEKWQTCSPCLPVETVRSIAKQCGFSTDDDMGEFLRFFESVGLLLHDDVFVCYEPEWLLQAITKVCGAKVITTQEKAFRSSGVCNLAVLRRIWSGLSTVEVDIVLHFLNRYRLVVGPFGGKYYVPCIMPVERPFQITSENCTEIFFHCHLVLKYLLRPLFPRLLGEACSVLNDINVHHIAQNTFTLSFRDECGAYLASFCLEDEHVRLILKSKGDGVSPVVVERILNLFQGTTRAFSPGLSFQAYTKVCCGSLVCLDILSSQPFIMCKDHEVDEDTLPSWVRLWRRCRVEGLCLADRKSANSLAVHYLYSSPLNLKNGGSVSRLRIEHELLLLANTMSDETRFHLSVSNMTSAHLREAFLRCPAVVIVAGHISEQRSALVVEDETGRGVLFPKDEFGKLPFRGVELVVLMACGSIQFCENIKGPSVISCKGKIFDSAAQLFTRSLCLALSHHQAQGRSTASHAVQAEAFEFAKAAIRTSPQPWAQDSEQFHFARGTSSQKPVFRRRPVGPSWTAPKSGWGRVIEDFVGREEVFVKVCSILQRRRLVRICGLPGVGKTAFGVMFARYFQLPERIFDRQQRLCVTESPDEVLGCLTQELVVTLYTGNTDLPVQLDQKVITFELPPLSGRNSAELFLLRIHRPIAAPKDLLRSGSQENSLNDASVPSVMSREELLALLPLHPVLRKCEGIPARIILTATKVTPRLSSLWELNNDV